MSLSPLVKYRQKLTQPDFSLDPKQEQAMVLLDTLFEEITASPRGINPSGSVKGLYLWGDVGRGKTMLMDLFCDALDDKLTLRLHFHRFMARIHKEMLAESGKRDPLVRIAKRIADECQVICFDEFFVADIGDAMILGTLFEALFKQGVLLVATSNIPIPRLYESGLQRDRFLSTITLLQNHCTEFHLDGKEDHRLRSLEFQQIYFLDQQADFNEFFGLKADEKTSSNGSIKILGRDIPVIKVSDDQAWFSFDALCDGPRSQLDYIELAARFDTLFVSDIPVLGGRPKSWIRARGTEDGAIATETGERQLSYAVGDDPARRFIALIDELYDQRVNLYLSAEVPLEELYSEGALSFEFRRTFSRLQEMQSKQYAGSSKRRAA
ncbi:cell division protein ZapE [Shewanella violacea]|uniref:AFG1-like ATPase superfamily n=1 Tax=Shewanella violacea (strain JCM 10179 / CIP 106290 / LMG 19151 / DSS12) TaxID=637905 RepID=D4ZFS8_SHEVD|nr:cell division protein ZapE [Shewanella violacea]BAJ00527.1 AFG1-like ATPase superfamily [Shewanella violacea DSS12]